MADTIIFPLSEETGQLMLQQLRRIAAALETIARGGGDTATYEGDELVVTGATVGQDGVLETTATVGDDGVLTF